MFIQELEIINILGCKHVKLQFPLSRSGVYVVQSPDNSPIRQAFCSAVQLICSGRYANIESLQQFEHLHQGCVRLVLLQRSRHTADPSSRSDEELNDDSDAPCTSQQAREREARRKQRQHRPPKQFYKLTALRDFQSNAEQIEYSIDDGAIQRCAVTAFHCKFRTTLDYVLPYMQQTRKEFQGDWLKCMATPATDSARVTNVFERFVQGFVRGALDNTLPVLTTTYLRGQKTVEVLLATDALQIFKETRAIFEYITYMEYTVWFLIPQRDGYVNALDEVAQSLDLKNMRVCVKLKTDNASREYEWIELSTAVQDLLFVAFKLALANKYKCGIVYLQDELNALRDHQTMELVTAAYLQRKPNGEMSADASSPLVHKNYVQRIVEACVRMQLTAIIEYPGGLPCMSAKANLIKCKKHLESGEWQLNLERSSACSLPNFIKCLEVNLQNY